MADSTIDSQLIMLYDNWPGYATRATAAPAGGFAEASAVHHNVAAAVYKIGEKVPVMETDIPGEGGESFSSPTVTVDMGQLYIGSFVNGTASGRLCCNCCCRIFQR